MSVMASEEGAVPVAEAGEGGEDVQKTASLEEVGLQSQREGEGDAGEQGKEEEGGGDKTAEPQAAAAAAASSVPQPPYDEDFNPFSEDGKLHTP